MPSDQELLKALSQDGPPPDSYWQHRSGGVYRVACCCLREADLTACVVYVAVKSGLYWCRPLAEFVDGRFTLLEKDE